MYYFQFKKLPAILNLQRLDFLFIASNKQQLKLNDYGQWIDIGYNINDASFHPVNVFINSIPVSSAGVLREVYK